MVQVIAQIHESLEPVEGLLISTSHVTSSMDQVIVIKNFVFCRESSPKTKVIVFSLDGSLLAWCNGER